MLHIKPFTDGSCFIHQKENAFTVFVLVYMYEKIISYIALRDACFKEFGTIT